MMDRKKTKNSNKAIGMTTQIKSREHVERNESPFGVFMHKTLSGYISYHARIHHFPRSFHLCCFCTHNHMRRTATAAAQNVHEPNTINKMLRSAVDTFPIWLRIREYIHQILSEFSPQFCCVIHIFFHHIPSLVLDPYTSIFRATESFVVFF